MSFIPSDEIRGGKTQSLAPMIDFLFLMLMFFATLAVSRVTTRDTEINLVEVKPETTQVAESAENEFKVVNLCITEEGDYKWITELRDYPMQDEQAVALELHKRYENGLLPQDRERTQVLLRIDKAAPWEPILRVIFAIREAGFDVHPVYIPDEQGSLADGEESDGDSDKALGEAVDSLDIGKGNPAKSG